MVVGIQHNRNRKVQQNYNNFPPHNLLIEGIFLFILSTPKYNVSHRHKTLNNLTKQKLKQNVIPAVDILLLSHMCGFNREKLSKGKSVISSFIICSVLRTVGCDVLWINSVLE